MTRALIWKEIREQGAVLIALVVLGAGILIAAAVLLEPSGSGQATELRSLTAAGRLGLVMLSITAGLVVGGTLFAGEREAGTFSFLDGLPGSRWRVWWRKVLTGVVLVTGAVTVFLTVAAIGKLVNGSSLTGWVLLTGMVAYAAYGWGVMGSVLARTSLAACGVGLALGTLIGSLLYVLTAVGLSIARRRLGLPLILGEYSIWELAHLVAGYTLAVIPLPIAAWLYTATDRARRLAALDISLPDFRGVVRSGLGRLPGSFSGRGLGRLTWLASRQLANPALALGGAALVAGCALVPDEAVPSLIWPVLGLFVGVLVGVVGLGDEQGSAAFRFWGERRLPVGSLWLVKILSGLGLTLFLVALLLLPATLAYLLGGNVRSSSGRVPAVVGILRSGLFAEPGFPTGQYLLVWPLYGFAFGHLCALLFRKAVVAGAVALLTGGTLAATWLPSLLGGGVHPWQVFVPVLVTFLTARVLSWSWVTDRLGTRRPLARLAGGAAAIALTMMGGIAYRVAEVPVPPGVEDDLQFAQELPTFDDRQAGRDLRRAVALLNEIEPAVREAKPESPVALSNRAEREPRTYLAQLPQIIETGWPTDRPDLDRWLDRMVEGSWPEGVEIMVNKPTGVLEDPAELAPESPLRHIDGVRQLTTLILARALQQQARGRPEVFSRAAVVSLAVIRTTRNTTLAVPALVGRAMEFQVYQALDHWLDQLTDRPDLLRAVLATLLEHDRRDPFDPLDVQLAHQVLIRNAVLAPSRWLPKHLDATRGVRRERMDLPTPASEAEANLVAFAWAVPWERERLRRVVGMGNRPGQWQEQTDLARGAPGWSVLGTDQALRPEIRHGERALLAARRAAILKLAVRLFAQDTNRLPERLEQLVPKYLAEVPGDPYDGRPFRYRISQGEPIEAARSRRGLVPEPQAGPSIELTAGQLTAMAGAAGGGICHPLPPGWMDLPEAPAAVAVGSPASSTRVGLLRSTPGQGILWSIGPDGFDAGGLVAIDPRSAQAIPVGDFVFPIPGTPLVREKP